MKQKKIYISGMHSGQNPSAGGSVAHSLRKAFPSLKLVGVDHWQGSSGLHDAVINDTLIFPQWKQIDDKRHAEHILSLLEEGNLWFPCVDMEVHWLSENLGRHKNLLAPHRKAIDLTAKPEVRAFADLGFRVPEFIPTDLSDAETHSFLRENSWRCWIKNPFHEARRVVSWDSFQRSRDAMTKSWSTSRLFLQRHVVGNEESLCFAAYQGELLGAIHMEKRQITPEGKTWAGRVSPIEPELFARLQEVVRRMEWSGGGELEFTRDLDGEKWIIECNPRFPAWIYGSAIVGMNLPAKIVARAWDMPLLESVSNYPFFTRVVQEIQAKESVGIPLPPDPNLTAWTTAAAKGKGGPAQAGFLPKLGSESEDTATEDKKPDANLAESVPPLYKEDLQHILTNFSAPTPARLPLPQWTASRFQHLGDRVREAGKRRPDIRIGFSMKTSPIDTHLQMAYDQGFHIECISQLEVKRALGFGFPVNKVILNGPGKFWPTTSPPLAGLHMLFCDSVDEFERMAKGPKLADCIGFRIRLPQLPSRFGIRIDKFENFQRLLGCLRELKGKSDVGFHFHMPSWAIGVKCWAESYKSLLTWIHTMEQLSGVTVKYIDLGGGFFPADLATLDFGLIQGLAAEILPKVEAVYFEPGRALTQDSEVLVSRILDVRRNGKDEIEEIVVDACIAELPLMAAYAHRALYKSTAAGDSRAPVQLLGKGDVRVLGRICMEDDVLCQGLDIPNTADIGDLVIFGDAGAYERTMSYVFGRG